MSDVEVPSAEGPWAPADPAARQLLSTGAAVVPILGAGMSYAAGLSGVSELAALLRSHPLAADIPFSKPEAAAAVADEILAQHPSAGAELRGLIADHFEDQQEGREPGQALRNLARCPSRMVITFNYDHLLEMAADAQDLPCHSWTWKNLPHPFWMSEGAEPGLHVIHIHGSVKDPDSIVLDSASYARVKADRLVQNFLRNLFSQMTVCFMGTSLSEPYVIEIIETTQAGIPRHVFLNDEGTARAARQRRLATTEQTVLIEPFGSDQFHVLEQIARDLANSPEDRRVDAPPRPGTPYEPLLVVPHKEGEDADSAAWSALSRFTDPVEEQTIRTMPLAVVRGHPGSGKSDLLKRMAELSDPALPDVHHPRYIRLSGCRKPLGSTEGLLADWAGLSSEELGSERFSFLFDGLDEVPGEDRLVYAKAIVDIAKGLPQHRFIVTSREVPELSLFPADWQQLQIASTSEWRSRFLARHTKRDGSGPLTWSALVEEVAELSSLEPLMRYPFFLKSVVDLYLAHKLPTNGDLLSLLEALIADSLDSDSLRLVGEDTALRWLSDLAMTMQLNGTVEAPRSTCEATSARVDIGDPQSLIDLLITRSMLRPGRDEGVAFVHRLVGDALVALKLEALGPGHPALLEAIAPSDSVTGLQGLRRDWMIPVILVGGRSPEWREALWDVDPVAAARCVPPDADPAERERAAETLWVHYKETRVWMSDRDLPVLIDTEEQLPRLITPQTMGALVEQIVSGLQDPSAQVRVNAIEVLSRISGLELADKLREAFKAEEETVRRAAALAARRLELRDLYEPIRDLALEAKSVEAQETGLAALSLVPDEELMELAAALISAGEVPDYFIEREAEGRFGALGRLRIIHVQAAAGARVSLNERHGLVEVLEELDLDEKETAEDVGFIAAAWGTLDPEIKAVIAAHPEATLQGMLRAVEEGAAPIHHMLRFLDVLAEDVIAAAAFSAGLEAREPNLRDELLDRRRLMTAPTPPASASSCNGDDSDEGLGVFESNESPRLAAALEDGSDELMYEARHLAREVGLLTQAQREQLVNRVNEWWPDSIRGAITPNERGRYSIEWKTSACLVYGPALQLPLSPDQWVDVALAPLYFDEVLEWLKATYTPDVAAPLLAALEEVEDPRRWARALESATTWPTEISLASAITNLDVEADADDFDSLAVILAQRDLEPALRALQELGGPAATAAQRQLAALGDVPTQRAMLTRLRVDLDGAAEITADGLPWLSAVKDPALLPLVFDCLVPAWKHRNPSGFNDSMAPLRAAIRRIGGGEALALLDEFLQREPEPYQGAHFEVLLRDEIADDTLRRAGLSGDRRLLEELRLPEIDR